MPPPKDPIKRVEWIRKRTGENNPMFGKHHTEEWKKKMRLPRPYMCGENHPMFGKHHTEEWKKNHSGENHPMFRKHHTEETKKKMSENHADFSGENNPSWLGGISFLPYCPKNTKSRKHAVRVFFGACICCGEHIVDYRWAFSVHHVDHDKQQGCDGKPFNLVPLCKHCHAKELSRIEEYKNYINKTLEEGFKWGIWNREEYMEKVMYK
jgi:hypothetical protein